MSTMLSLPKETELSATGLSLPSELTQDQWLDAGRQLALCQNSLQWWVGDWLNYGERRYGEVKLAIEELGLKYGTATTWAWVSSEYEVSKRLETLSWSHHHAAASEPNKNRRAELLSVNQDGTPKYTVAEIKDKVRKRKLAEAEKQNPIPSGQFRVLYADPPWFYNDQRLGTVEGGGAVAHYPTMKTDEICEMGVRELGAASSVLFLWATAPCLSDAVEVMESWGYEYKAQFVWDKVRGFNGHYNDVCHELLLIGTRGSCVPKSSSLRKSIVTAEKSQHSRKPDEFYSIIEGMYDGPYCELFARRERDGWTSWGNEV